MIDTRGIEIRTGRLSEDYVSLEPGSRFTLYTGERVGDATGVSVSYRRLDEEVRAGVPILLDDGAIRLDNCIEWNGRDDYGDRLARGVYLYKVTMPQREDYWGRVVIIR